MTREPFWPWDEGYDDIPDEVNLLVTDEYFDQLKSEADRPARTPDPKMVELHRRFRVQHRDESNDSEESAADHYRVTQRSGDYCNADGDDWPCETVLADGPNCPACGCAAPFHRTSCEDQP